MPHQGTILEPGPAFFDEKGEFPKELFVKDGVHFSEKGYEVLAGLLRKKL